jgi:hypothetical protein
MKTLALTIFAIPLVLASIVLCVLLTMYEWAADTLE